MIGKARTLASWRPSARCCQRRARTQTAAPSTAASRRLRQIGVHPVDRIIWIARSPPSPAEWTGGASCLVEARQKQQLNSASFCQLGLRDFLVKGLHDVFVGTGVDGGPDARQVAFSSAEHNLGRLAVRPCAQFFQETSPSRTGIFQSSSTWSGMSAPQRSNAL